VRYIVVNDSGRLVNPRLVDGQITGGIAQGLGGALLEEFMYDSEGQLLSTNLSNYHLPTTLDVPPVTVHHVESPSPHNPLGMKGVGEGGAIGAHAAIANAVADALGKHAATVRATPLTPE